MTTADRDAKVTIRGLGREFTVKGKTIEALSRVDLDIRAGEFVSLVGPSGCGKTTLLRIVAGLEKATSGSVEIVHEKGASRPLNAMVFQEQSIFPWMTVRDNVAFGLKARGVRRKDRYAIVDPIVEMVGLSEFALALPHQLSGGMKQRVSLARAWANDPEILLMDEPFAALDEQTKLSLEVELLQIWETTRKTVLYVTHSIDEALFLSDRIVVMTGRPGRIQDILDLSELMPRPRGVSSVRGNPHYGALFDRIWTELRNASAEAVR
jgi:NitT/TauT family transport system ATP-binding protein